MLWIFETIGPIPSIQKSNKNFLSIIIIVILKNFIAYQNLNSEVISIKESGVNLILHMRTLRLGHRK
jgi:hypothetical protein